MILYTTTEGGDFHKLPFKSSHQKIVKHLYKHRNVDSAFPLNEYISRIPQPGRKPTIIVYAVFFKKKNGSINKVWDANLNGYRDLKKPPYRYVTGKEMKNIVWMLEEHQK